MIDASGGVTLLCAENLSVLISSACDFLQYAARIFPVRAQPKSLGALDNRQQRTAFESYNGRLDFLAGTALHAPKPTPMITLMNDEVG